MPSLSGSPDLPSMTEGFATLTGANAALVAANPALVGVNPVPGGADPAQTGADPAPGSPRPNFSVHGTTPLGQAALGEAVSQPGIGTPPFAGTMPQLHGGVPPGTQVARMEGGLEPKSDFASVHPSEQPFAKGDPGDRTSGPLESGGDTPLPIKEVAPAASLAAGAAKPHSYLHPHAPAPGVAKAAPAPEKAVAKAGPAQTLKPTVAQEGPNKGGANAVPGTTTDKTREAIKEAQHDGSIFGPIKNYALEHPFAVAGLVAAAAAAMGGGWKWSLVAGVASYLGVSGLKMLDEKTKKADGFDKIAEIHGQGTSLPAPAASAPAKKG